MRIRRRLLLWLLAFSLAAGVILDVAGHAVLRASLRGIAAERLERESALLAGVVIPVVEGRQPVPAGRAAPDASLDAWIDEIGSRLRLRVTLIDAGGKVLADSDVPASQIPSVENHLRRAEVQAALVSGSGRARRFSDTVGQEMSYFARRLDGAEGPSGFVRLAIPTSELEAGGGRLRAFIALTAAATFAILSAIAYAVTRRLSAPVEAIAASADLVASGRFEAPIEVEGGAAEVDALAASLRRMRDALLDQIRAVEAEHRLLNTVLSGMREALLAVDVNRRIILANASLRRDFDVGPEEVQGRPLAEVVRDPGAGEAFARTLAERAETRVSVTVRFPAERTFELLVAPLDSPEGQPLGAIGLFLDVTRLQALERMRREFIADISHEMRTPLASLTAAVENLLGAAGADPADRAQFLAIVRRNAERMQALINDLTDLSLIETGAITLEPETIRLREIVGDVLATLAGRAAARGVTLASDVPEGLQIRADRRRLDQVLVNVVDNAIKFNRPGGSVAIAAGTQNGAIVLAVEDSGPGIPHEDREKVFQRFYRSDRSRSREAGGTGLGLAIVKHLMRMHGGSVRAEAREGGGTRIVLAFPPAAGA